MRENGYYWVKLDVNCAFEPAFKQGKYWLVMGVTDCHEDSDFHEINPQRILTPDEQENLNNGE